MSLRFHTGDCSLGLAGTTWYFPQKLTLRYSVGGGFLGGLYACGVVWCVEASLADRVRCFSEETFFQERSRR